MQTSPLPVNQPETLDAYLLRCQRHYVDTVLERNKFRISVAAKQAGRNRQSFYRLLSYGPKRLRVRSYGAVDMRQFMGAP